MRFWHTPDLVQRAGRASALKIGYMTLNIDRPLPEKYRQRAIELLTAAGFDASDELLLAPVRAVVWKLGSVSAQRRKTALELLELADGSDEAA